MTKEEIQKLISGIMFPEYFCGIEIFACIRKEDRYHAKKIKATDRLLLSIKDKLSKFISCKFLAEDAEFETSENIADNKKIFYEIKLTANYNPFAFLGETANGTDHYVESDRQQLSGFLFKINLNEEFFWIYQHVYPVAKFDKSKGIYALFVKDTYDELREFPPDGKHLS